MKTLLNSALIIAAVTSLVHAQEGQLRLSPSEIKALANVNAGAGTSGVSGIQTRTLKGDATKPGIYKIQLIIPTIASPPSSLEPGTSVYGANFDESKLKPHSLEIEGGQYSVYRGAGADEASRAVLDRCTRHLVQS